MSILASDAEVRQQALEPLRSFCVQAPAGSGKTELLTQRLLMLLAHCERPEEILAFTFTRKASAEMRNRLLQSLEDAAASDDEILEAMPAHKRQTMILARAALARDALLGWNLLHNSQRLRINTIDSFTSWLTSRLPLASGFGSSLRISTDMKSVLEQAVRETLATLEGNNESADKVASLLRHLHGDLAKAETLLMTLLQQRDQWLPLLTLLRAEPRQARQFLENSLRILLAETVDEASFRLSPWNNSIMELLQHAAANGNDKMVMFVDTHALPPATPEAAIQWQALASFFLLADAEDFRKQVNKTNGFPPKSATRDVTLALRFESMLHLFKSTVNELRDNDLLQLLQRLAKLPPASYEDAQWEVLEHCIALLPVLAVRLEIAMRERGIMDHTQTALAAITSLGTEDEPTDLALLLDYRIRHLLVDEFQDTSSMQFELLKLLTAGWSEGDGRTLFIVGDGMQSCYAFRNANVGLFLRAREQVGNVSMELLKLEVNFRSSRQIVNWVNQVFAPAFPREDDSARGGVSYSASVASGKLKDSIGVQCRFQVTSRDGLQAAQLRQLQAVDIAALCQRLLDEHPEESVAILVRNRSNLDALVPALRQTGLRWNAEDIDPLLSYQPILDLFTLLRALTNLADVTAWLALLRCPFVGLELTDLEQLARYRLENGCSVYTALLQHENLSGLGATSRLRLQRVVPVLQQARAMLQIHPLADLLESLWLELGGPSCLDDSSMLNNINTFFRLVEAAAPQGDILDIHHFKQQLQVARGSTRDQGVRLQIMTIHKAKGLEFDHVILPELDRLPRNNGNPLLLWNEYLDRSQRTMPMLALMTRKGDENDPVYHYLRGEAAQRSSYETTRLLYIAVTRAARSAWLFGSLSEDKNGQYKCGGTSLLASILPVVNSESRPSGMELLPAPVSSEDAIATGIASPSMYRRLPPHWHAPYATSPMPLTNAIDTPEPTHDLLAAAVGELVHQGLQYIVQGYPLRVAESAFPAWWISKLRPLCHDAASLELALGSVRSQLQACLDSNDAGWLFKERQEADACELALVDWSSGQRRDYSIDRTFIDSHGVRWIIDYKSSTPLPGQALDAFLQEQVDRHRVQLQTYARLMQGMESRSWKLALYFTALPIPRLHIL